MKFIESMINYKVNKIQPKELMNIAAQNNIQLTDKQAGEIASVLAGHNINIFDPAERQRVLKQIAAIAGEQTAAQTESLFAKLTSSL